MGDILRQSYFAHMPIIRDIVYGAAARGVSLHDICKKLKVDVADLDDSEKRAGFETSCRAWELAVKMTGDPQLGLHLGENTNPSILGLVGLLMQNSKTLLDAFRQVSKYGRIATNMFAYGIIETKNEVILQYTPVLVWKQLYPNGARQAVEQAKAGTLNVFYLLSGERIRPKASKKDQLIFDREQLATPVLRYDRSLFRILEEIARKKGQRQTFAGQVKDIILNDFKGQVPTIEILASRLNMTVRSMQRRLEVENTTFRHISLQITKEMGARLLKSGSYKVVDVAKILGYSSPRAFRRAFKA
jgi:AraC-like DNA-binding protein